MSALQALISSPSRELNLRPASTSTQGALASASPAIRAASSLSLQTPSLQGRVHTVCGSHQREKGVFFQVYAPHAREVALTLKDKGADSLYPMHTTGTGQWKTHIEEAKEGDHYQYLITTKEGEVYRKADPFGMRHQKRDDPFFQFESCVTSIDPSLWTDRPWIEGKKSTQRGPCPLSIYKIRPLVWDKHHGHTLTYTELAEKLLQHCKDLGFTHVYIEDLLDSLDPDKPERAWNYFTPSRNLGTIQQLQQMINHMHGGGIGVLMRLPLAEIGCSQFGLNSFDGPALFEEERLTEKRFALTNPFVCNYLTSALDFWSTTMHIDGFVIDVDEVSLSPEPLDSDSVEPYGGYAYHAGRAFLHNLIRYTRAHFAETLLIAKAKRPFSLEGFDYKITEEPSIGPVDNRFFPTQEAASLRTLSHVMPLPKEEDPQALSYYLMQLSKMFCLPGAKLLEMGEELGQPEAALHREHKARTDVYMTAVDWEIKEKEPYKTTLKELEKLHALYRSHPALAPHAPCKPLASGHSGILCYERTSIDESESLICIHNISEKEQKLSSVDLNHEKYTLCYRSDAHVAGDVPDSISPFTTFVLKKNE